MSSSPHLLIFPTTTRRDKSRQDHTARESLPRCHVSHSRLSDSPGAPESALRSMRPPALRHLLATSPYRASVTSLTALIFSSPYIHTYNMHTYILYTFMLSLCCLILSSYSRPVKRLSVSVSVSVLVPSSPSLTGTKYRGQVPAKLTGIF